MADRVDIQVAIEEGRDAVAEVLGSPFKVYRITDTSNGNLIADENLINEELFVFTKLGSGTDFKSSLETEKLPGIFWYVCSADFTDYLVGDVFILNEDVYGAGFSSVSFATDQFNGFALAQHMVLKKALGGRLIREIKVFRLNDEPDADKRWSQNRDNSLPLTLRDGQYVFGAKDEDADLIPVGLMATGRSYGDRSFEQVPSMARKSGWECYVPPLPGFSWREGDRIETFDGARFTVVVPYEQLTGTCGAQLFLEREVAQL